MLNLPATAAECTAASGSQRVAVLELYTFEGCDSCPSADKWVGELPAKKLTTERLIPLAFHVDYWNHLALYENNLATAVKAGENKGRMLHHDFVVRELVGPLARDDQGRLSHAQSFPLDARWKPLDTHLAVFVQHPQSGEVLQALGASCY